MITRIGVAISGFVPLAIRDHFCAALGKMTGHRGRYLGDAGMAFAVRIAGAGIGFGLQVLMARQLNLTDYGLYVTYWTWLIVLGQISALGFNDSCLRFLPRYAARNRPADALAYLGNGIWIVTLGSAAIAIAGVAIALFTQSYFGALELRLPLILLLCLGIPVIALELYLEGICRSFGWFMLSTVPAFVLRPAVMASVIATVAYFEIPLHAAAVLGLAVGIAMLFTFMMGAIIYLRLKARYAAHVRHKSSIHRKRRLWLFAALPLVLVYGIEELFLVSDILLLALLVDPAEVGIYFAAVRIMTLAGYIYYAFMLISSREFSLARADRDHAELQRRVAMATRWTFLLTVPAVAGILLAGPVLLAMFGPDFAAAWPALAVLGLGLVARASVGQAGDLLVILGYQRDNLIIAGLSLILNIAITLALVPLVGILGAAIGTALSQAARAAALRRTAYHRAGLETFILFQAAHRLPDVAPARQS